MEQLIGKENTNFEINWTLLKIKVDQEDLNLMDVDAQNIENSTMPCNHDSSSSSNRRLYKNDFD